MKTHLGASKLSLLLSMLVLLSLFFGREARSATIWSESTVPSNPAVTDGTAIEVGVKFRSDVSGHINGLRFYKGANNTGTHTGRLWNQNGILLAAATFTSESSSGWQQVLFSTPVSITANTTYVASYYSPSGYFAVNLGYFASAGVDNPPLHALANGVSGGNGVYKYGTSGFPTQTFNSNNYWVDVVFTPSSGDSEAPAVTSFTLPSASSTLEVSINSFTATDNVGVTGYMVTETAAAPSGSSSGWLSFAPDSYTFSSAGSKTLYAWARDAAGNVSAAVSATVAVALTARPEPADWHAGDMHVHRSCGGSPESIASIFSKMGLQDINYASLLADMGNGEVQDPVQDLPRVTGQDDPVSTPGRILHWDGEWHWDPTYTQFPHEALGGHVVALGLTEAGQIWQEYTLPIFQWIHQRKGVAGFAHMQYLTDGFPQSLNCCIPLEYPVEVALGSADFISEDVAAAGTSFSGMDPENFIKAYYRLLNSGFRPGFAAGTDYPCGNSEMGSLLTYVQASGQDISYKDWIQGISKGRTVVSRNGHKEFLKLTVNSSYGPGDEIKLSAPGSVSANVQWTASQNLSGTVELVRNGVVVESRQASASPGAPAGFSVGVSFTKSGWLVARRMGTSGHVAHTAAVFVSVGNAPVRASVSDAQFYVQWMDNLLSRTSEGGAWSSYFPTSRTQAQERYQAARKLFAQIALEAGVTGAPALSSVSVTPGGETVLPGAVQQLTSTGNYSDGSTINLSAQTNWSSSNPAVATVNRNGLVTAVAPGTAIISAALGSTIGITTLTVSNAVRISTDSLPSGGVSSPYSATLTAEGGTPPYAWSVAAGALPPGLALAGGTGVISGTPTTIGTFNLTIRVSDSSSPVKAASKAFTIGVGSQINSSLWPATAVPGQLDGGPDRPVELGVRFYSETAGYITGIRFYKASANTGIHVANLWSSSGASLASAAFINESASGWQQVNFKPPVPISANTVYVASYFCPAGHYSYDHYYFSGKGIDAPPLHALADGVSGSNGIFSYGSSSRFPTDVWRSSNYWADVVFVQDVLSDNARPEVAAFTVPPSSISLTVPVTRFTANDNVGVTAYMVNESPTEPSSSDSRWSSTLPTSYTFTSEGAKTLYAWAKDAANNISAGRSATISVAGLPVFGGPILVVTSPVNHFTGYYPEILRAEGFTSFAVADISSVTSATLSSYDVVILGEMPLAASQVTMLSDWVNGGGNLLAMRPDKKLSGLLGLTDLTSTLSNAYLLVNTSSGPGTGIVGQAIQFHGTADRYALNGASGVATLYSSPTASTTSPAVTLKNVGSNGGQAAAFTYDLARSVVYTRQGNPAWAGQERDGFPPIRSDDLFYGAAGFDPQPDWNNLDKVAIPQADEQQRLLANLIIGMNSDKKPLPRFWYFPRNLAAVVIMTGDDHDGGGTAGRFDNYISRSPANCSTQNWECIRGTSYIYPTSMLSNAQVSSYNNAGFELALHANTGCATFTLSSYENFISSQLDSWSAKYSSLPLTNRNHCIAWGDYVNAPFVEGSHGIRFDTSYYFWPSSWVDNRPGFFTGSGIPMRFSDPSGNLIDVYQAPTQMTDESGQTYPFTIDSLLDRAIGAEGYYGAFVANMHTDEVGSSGSDAIISSAASRGIPVISARQMLQWLDARNSSSFNSLSWTGNSLSFSITAGSGATGLVTMVPVPVGMAVSGITRNGSPVQFTTATLKGVPYARFLSQNGAYQVNFSVDATPPTIIGVSPANGSANVSTVINVSATFSEGINPATVGAATFELRDASNTLVSGVVNYVSSTNTAVFDPAGALATGATYSATIKGGSTGVRDAAGNPLNNNVSWSFTTTATPSALFTIWPASTVPTYPAISDGSAIEVGVKFSSDAGGYIKGLRFFKGAGNTGTHIGNLWDRNGSLLASATFTNETSSGWQEVLFPTPVAITAGTTYVASYHSPLGFFAINHGYFAAGGVDNSPLHALANGIDGGNGVYKYGATGFPAQTFNSNNYWVDVLFQQ